MKLSVDGASAQTAGVLEKSQARIKMSAHAFSILADGLYTNKIEAVLREVGCNARDAHVEAGKSDLPIEVRLPTPLDCQFWIKDWGIGLDRDQVMNMYLTFFESTKSDSDDFVGAFGLGSKSPFAYTDSFTVTAAKGGIKRVFTVYKEQGIPQCVLLHEEAAPADWQNGLQVGFPVNPKDVGTFQATAERVFAHWDLRPVVLGAELDFASRTPKMLTATCGRDPAGEAAIVMGGVRYPLPELQGWEDAVPEELRQVVARFINNIHPSIRVPIGTVSVTPSRESLSLDDSTRKNLAGLVIQAAREVCGYLMTEAARLPDESEWVWRSRVATHMQRLGGYSLTVLLREAMGLFQLDQKSVETLVEAATGAAQFGTQQGNKFSLYEVEQFRRRKDKRRLTLVHKRDTGRTGPQSYYLQVSESVRFIFEDDKRQVTSARKAVRFSLDNPALAVFYVRPNGDAEASVRAIFGNPPDDVWMKVSSLPELPKAVKGAVTGAGAVSSPKFDKGNVLATVWTWGRNSTGSGDYTGSSNRRIALLDGTSRVILTEHDGSALNSPLVCWLLAGLDDAELSRLGLDQVVALSPVVYDRYKEVEALRPMASVLKEVAKLPQSVEKLRLLARLSARNWLLFLAIGSPGNAYRYNNPNWFPGNTYDSVEREFFIHVDTGLLLKHMPRKRWFRRLLQLDAGIVAAVDDECVLNVNMHMDGSQAGGNPGSAGFDFDWSKVRVSNAPFGGEWLEPVFVPLLAEVAKTVPTGADWTAAAELGYCDDTTSLLFALNEVIASDEPRELLTHGVDDYRVPPCASLKVDVLARLVADTRRKESLRLRKEGAKARARRKEEVRLAQRNSCVIRDLFETVDMPAAASPQLEAEVQDEPVTAVG